MNMEKKTEDFQVENMLENWQKKPLDDKALLAAQSRVWSKIQAKVSNSNPISNNLSNLSMADNQNTEEKSSSTISNVKSPRSWFLKPLGLSLISLSLVIILVGVTSAVYIQNLQTQLAQKQNLTNQNSNQNSQKTDASLAKLDLSLDEIRSKATIKLNTITNGVSLDEIQASSEKTPKMVSTALNAGGLGAGGGNSSSVNAPTPDILVKEKGIVDNVVYYTENISQETGEGYLYSYLSKTPGFDIKKPIKSQSWSSANYSKYILSQDGKIINYNTYSPDFSVDYKSGKYAIKELFDQKIYLSGIDQTLSNSNSEISYLRSILTDTTLKDGGKQEIDGNIYKILETDASKMGVDTTGDSYSIKYYIDQEKLSVFITENYINKKLVSSTTQTNYQEIKDPKLDDIFGVKDLGQIPLRSITGSTYDESDQNLLKISSKADIYIPKDLSENALKNNLYAYDSSVYVDSESAKLRNTKDFDPSLDEGYLNTLLNPPLISYSFNNTSVNVYKTKILEEPFIKVANESNKSIQIDGKKTEVKFKTVYYDYGYGEGASNEVYLKTEEPAPFYRLEFTASNGLFYQIVEYKPYDGSTEIYTQGKNINLVKLDNTLATKIYTYQQDRQKSYPDIDYEAKLESISKNIRILPGDLLKSDKMVLSGVVKSKKLGSLSTCDQFLTSGYDLQNCLVEKYNGFSLNFYEKTDSNTSDQSTTSGSPTAIPAMLNDLTFSVLDQKFDSIDLSKFVDTINVNNPITKNVSNIVTQINAANKEYYYSDGFSGNTIYFIAIGDKTIMATSYALGKDRVLEIVKNSALDKDLNILSNQLKESLTPQPVDIPTLMNK